MRAWVALLGLLLSVGSAAWAAPPEVPSALEPWRAWVLDGHEHRRCPFLFGQAPGEPAQHVCAWPSRLELSVDGDGAGFRTRWRVLEDSEIALPGDARHPPLAVRVGGQPAAVLQGHDGPRLQLAPGEHEIEGRLDWDRRPEQLAVPEVYALLALSLDGQDIAVPEREGARLWLGRARVEEAEDSLALKVFRLLSDGVPQTLATRIELEVGGRARETRLGLALPEGFRPMALRGALPALLEADGGLRVQLRPGRWVIELDARAADLMERFAPSDAVAPWPAEEVWSFAADPRLRVVQPGGELPVDPAQVGVPFAHDLPAFVLNDEAALRLETRTRGLPADAPHRLSLTRELWLDFGGSGLTARDQVSGRLSQGARLDMGPPWRLERAAADDQDLLVTAGEGEASGVELRQTDLALSATARIEGRGELPVNGWRQAFDSVRLDLNLPPGWALVHASGVDRAPGTWVARWSLLDIFLACLAVLLAHRALGWPLAGLVLGYLLLGYHERSAPLWSLIAVLALGLCVRWLPAGRFAQALRVAAFAFFAGACLLALPFAAQQLKLALFPQLERGEVSLASQAGPYLSTRREVGDETAMAEARLNVEEAEPPQRQRAVPNAPAEMAMPAPPPLPKGGFVQSVEQKRNLNQYPSDAVLQAGRGDPDWRWQRQSLQFSGPVAVEQSLRLWLSPPWLTRLGRIAVVALLALVLWRLLPVRWVRVAPASTMPPPAGAAAMVLFALLLPALPTPVQAQSPASAYPPPELLDELRERLLRAPDCLPDCARLAQAELRIEGSRLRIAMEWHAATDLVVPLPEAGKLAAPLAATVDGFAAPVLRQQGQGWLRLTPGIRRAVLELALSEADGIELRFPLPPGRIAVQADGWEVAGLDGRRLQGDSLQLLRQRRSEGAGGETVDESAARQDFPPFVRIERNLDLGLDWSLSTRVQRLAPESAGFTVEVPLLPGERLQDDNLPRRGDRLQLAFSRGQQEFVWRSTLPVGEQLALVAGGLESSAEVWNVAVGPFWRVRFDGTPAVASPDPGAVWSFLPFPGESLQLDVARPEALGGESLAIDGVGLNLKPGQRATDASLGYTLRATRGGHQVLTLPAAAELLRVSVDEREHHLKLQDGRLSLPVTPGAQRVVVEWREAKGLGAHVASPAVDLGVAASNLRVELALPERWLLLAGGGGVGPALLYWPQLLLLVLLAFALSRHGGTPLGFGAWLLLGLGFSTVSWLAAGVVAGWLLLLGWRGRSAALPSHRAFPAVQIGLVLLSLAALLCLVAAIPYGLLNDPDMRVTGNGSSAGYLRWFFDRSEGVVPTVWAISLPLWAYQIAILAWALWLANALLGWLRWGWGCFAQGGLWPKSDSASKARRAVPPPPPPTAGSADAAADGD